MSAMFTSGYVCSNFWLFNLWHFRFHAFSKPVRACLNLNIMFYSKHLKHVVKLNWKAQIMRAIGPSSVGRFAVYFTLINFKNHTNALLF